MSESLSNKIDTDVLQKARDQVQSSYPEQKTPVLDNIIVASLLEDIKKVPSSYRDGYSKQKTKEDGTPGVDIRTYNLEGENVYGRYAKTTPDQLISEKKLNGVLKYSGEGAVNASIESLKFDIFSSLSGAQKIDVVDKVAPSLGFKIAGNSLTEANIGAVRDTMVLSYNNSRLREINVPTTIEVRKDVAERLSIANRYLRANGISLGVSNGLRTSEVQRTIKGNHEAFRGRGEADKLFAAEDASPHLSGGAVDVYLIKDGKKLDLKLGDNSPETKSPLYTKETPSQKEQEVIQLRHRLLDAMTRAGFVVNPTEYWHFAYGDKMWAYITEITTGEPTTAVYDALK